MGYRVAIVGAGPAGLAAADILAREGIRSVVYDAYPEIGGLLTYGIPPFKLEKRVVRKRRELLEGMGVRFILYTRIGEDKPFAELVDEYDAVFLGIGLSGSNELGVEGETTNGVVNATDYIAELRQARDKSTLPVGKAVVVIGGGMTAVDIAIQSRHLGAEQVHMVYRRGPEKMSASAFEQAAALCSAWMSGPMGRWPWPTPRPGKSAITQPTERSSNGRRRRP